MIDHERHARILGWRGTFQASSCTSSNSMLISPCSPYQRWPRRLEAGADVWGEHGQPAGGCFGQAGHGRKNVGVEAFPLVILATTSPSG